MIAVIDSGVANLASVLAALHRLEAEAEVTVEPAKIRNADHVLLPGVGSAAAAMAQLRGKKLVGCLCGLTQPVLGICLGMQLLFESSEENTGTEGLGILPGTVRKMSPAPDMPVPHMGWNQLEISNSDHALLKDVKNESFVYFVHGYAAPVSAMTLAATNYGTVFTSVVGYKNFFGCQFHPERSSTVGSRILKNFIAM
jgi:imidazole glycerol-phosphate synthase subunit HisH